MGGHLHDVSTEAIRCKRKKSNYVRMSLEKTVREYNGVSDIFFFNLGVFFSSLYYDLSKIKNVKVIYVVRRTVA